MKHETKLNNNHDWHKATPPRVRRASGQPRRAGNKSGEAVRGAIRMDPLLVARRKPDLRYWLKVSAGLMFATGGVLVATTSTGTVEPIDRVAVPLLPIASFSFSDMDDALGKSVATTLDAHEERTKAPEEDRNRKGPHNPGTQQANAGQPGEQARHIANNPRPRPSAAADTTLRLASTTFPPSGLAPAVAEAADTLIDEAAGKSAKTPATANDEVVETITVASGDTLSGILNRQGLGLSDIRELLADPLIGEQLTRLAIGQKLDISRDAAGKFLSLSTRSAVDRRITIETNATGFAVAEADLPLVKKRVVTSGTIENSLYLAAAEASLKQSTIMELADIFQWELDFARDIRKGDQFALVYDRLFRDDKYVGDGDILAAEFVRGGRTYQAVRFTTSDGESGYYAPDGQSMRRTFLRHPVDVVRVTSRFDPNRLHPVLHQIRAHRGVDYGSPYGTPIRATADGTISFAGAQSTYGNLVILQHGQEFSTLYAHMSKVADKSITGHKVQQGDIIGYVGNTGRVTGTHLHYEFRVRGVHVDPLKVELPAAQPIATEYREALRSISDEMLAQMQGVIPESTTRLAKR